MKYGHESHTRSLHYGCDLKLNVPFKMGAISNLKHRYFLCPDVNIDITFSPVRYPSARLLIFTFSTVIAAILYAKI